MYEGSLVNTIKVITLTLNITTLNPCYILNVVSNIIKNISAKPKCYLK